MTPTDELWMDMAQFDSDLADALWGGTSPPEDAPAWWHEVSSLVRAARGPATEDELAGSDRIVARMAEVVLAAARDDASADDEQAEPGVAAASPGADLAPGTGAGEVLPGAAEAELPCGDEVGDDARADADRDTAPDGDEVGDEGGDEAEALPTALAEVVALGAATRARRPRHLRPAQADPERRGGFRLVRRLVAVKAVATTTAVAIGITAAAAATGVVVTVVDPPRRKPEPPPTTVVVQEVDDEGTATPERGRRDERSGSDRRSPAHDLTCAIDLGCPDGPPTPTSAPVAPTTSTTAASSPSTTATTATTEPLGESVPTTGSPTTTATTVETTTTTSAPPTEPPPSSTTSTTLAAGSVTPLSATATSESSPASTAP